jgi:hypothetical protein
MLREGKKKKTLKMEVVNVLHKYGYGDDIYYTILFDNGAKMDYITRDMLEFVKE